MKLRVTVEELPNADRIMEGREVGVGVGVGLSIHCMQSHRGIFLAELGDVCRRHGTKFNEGTSTIRSGSLRLSGDSCWKSVKYTTVKIMIRQFEYLLLLLLLLLLLSAIEFSLGGSSPYTSTDKTNKNKYT
jgi:hypothetical protein